MLIFSYQNRARKLEYMSKYTTIGKTIICPCFSEAVTLTGKYTLTHDQLNPDEAKFSYATCPIIENSHLPICDQTEEYKYIQCAYHGGHCNFLSIFPDTISLNDI